MGIEIEISTRALVAIRSHAASSPDYEVCGLLFGEAGRIDAAEPARNVAADPARHFEIDPSALFRAIRAERAGAVTLVGYYHSHPQGIAEPSETDRQSAAADGKIWFIVADDEVAAWRFDGTAFESVAIRMC